MTQAFSAETFRSTEDTLPKNTNTWVDGVDPLTTSDIVILGEDVHTTYENQPDFTGPLLPTIHDKEFIGPRDATDISRNFVMTRAKDLAQIAVKDFTAYEGERARFVSLVHERVNEGTLRLNDEYASLSVDQQLSKFVMDSINHSVKSKYEVESELEAERVALHLGSKGPERALQLEVNTLKKSVQNLAGRILKVREMLVEKGASEEFIKKFDYTTKLMSKPDLEAYEREMELDPEHEETPPLVDTAEITLLDRFKTVLSPSFGRKALRSMGVRAPKSAEVEVIAPSATTTEKH